VSTRAHTVPKFYLNGFVAPGSEHEQNPSVWVGSLTTGEITKRSPEEHFDFARAIRRAWRL
jgi:hypothetical protein